jgi:phospholipase C
MSNINRTVFPSTTLSSNRRHFIKTTAAATGAVAFGLGHTAAAEAIRSTKGLPKPQSSGVEHFVIVMMENRSFDHFLGWLPGADGRQAGLSYLDRFGGAHSPLLLASDYQGCTHPDPDHTYEGGRVEYNHGACDGWLKAGQNDDYAIGYYTQGDLSFLGAAAPAWTTCDAYFSAIMAETFPNRIYQHAAQTDRLDGSMSLSTLPTIWDRLAEHSLSALYYFTDVPFTALWGTRYLSITRPIGDFFGDCARGTLPRVSMVDPGFLGEQIGLSNDDHPHADIRNGEVFLNSVYEAVTSSPNWPQTILIFNFDEWGGFFEHVPPGIAPIPRSDAALGSDGLRGFRVPCLVISPWSPRQMVAHGTYDHTSILRMIEWRWHLRPLTIRDASANNLAEVMDFTEPNLNAPRFAVPGGFFGSPCPLLVPAELNQWAELRAMADHFAFPSPAGG